MFRLSKNGISFFVVWLIIFNIVCLLISQSNGDDDLTITDEEQCTSCGTPKGRSGIESEKQKKKPRKEPRDRPHGGGPGRPGQGGHPGHPGHPDQPPLTEEELIRQLESMPTEQREEIMKGYREYLKQEEQKPEVQEELKNQFPQLKYPDTAYRSFDEIPTSKMPPKTFGCGQVFVPSGKFTMGSDDDENYVEDGESPVRKVRIKNGFWIDACEVTNGQFLEFWDKMKMKKKTEAEKYGWTFVFELAVSDEINKQITSAVQGAEWWVPVPNADFRHPHGPDMDFNNKLDHPVIHIGWTDANKYCNWVGGRLPSEAEWEYASRGGLEQKKFPWGNEIQPFKDINGTFSMNIFTGTPYTEDDGSDGWPYTAVVGSFLPNGYGIYDMTGNVWEWVNDIWTNRPKQAPDGQRLVNPKGPKRGRDRVMKGGSYMCHQTTCRRYRCSGRAHAEPDSSTGNLGFRCVYDKKPQTRKHPTGVTDEIADEIAKKRNPKSTKQSETSDQDTETHDEL